MSDSDNDEPYEEVGDHEHSEDEYEGYISDELDNFDDPDVNTGNTFIFLVSEKYKLLMDLDAGKIKRDSFMDNIATINLKLSEIKNFSHLETSQVLINAQTNFSILFDEYIEKINNKYKPIFK